MTGRSVDSNEQLVGLERLGQVVERPLPYRLDGRRDRGVSGHDDHRERRVVCLCDGEHRHAIHLRHPEIEQQDIRARGAQQLAEAGWIGERGAGVTLPRENAPAVLEHRRLVVDYENASAVHVSSER